MESRLADRYTRPAHIWKENSEIDYAAEYIIYSWLTEERTDLEFNQGKSPAYIA